MTDLDRTLSRLIGEEAAREAEVTPPPLADLRARAAGHRRRRWATLALGAAAAAVVAVAAVQLWPDDSGTSTTAPAGKHEGDRYEVPTFTWDPDQGGDAAMLEGTVSMTVDGCAVVVSDTEPHRVGVVLPNAHGTRQVDGESRIYSSFPEGQVLMAQDGMEVMYGGGGGGGHEDWSRLCPDSPVDHIFWVYATAP